MCVCMCVFTQILEDVSEEHARKTITVDPHPHLNISAASIHPCRHAGGWTHRVCTHTHTRRHTQTYASMRARTKHSAVTIYSCDMQAGPRTEARAHVCVCVCVCVYVL